MVDLRKWLELMDTYEAGGFMYHATMPTDALMTFRCTQQSTVVRSHTPICYSPLATRYLLLATCYSLYLLLASRYSLLATCY